MQRVYIDYGRPGANEFANLGAKRATLWDGIQEIHVMPRPTATRPTDVELQILGILWELGPSPVRDIHKRLEDQKGTNYSTTVKMLAVMLDKGLVKRDGRAQPHVYRPGLSRKSAGQKMLGELIDKVYEGSAMSLVLQALSSTRATKEERDEARRLLDQMEEKQS